MRANAPVTSSGAPLSRQPTAVAPPAMVRRALVYGVDPFRWLLQAGTGVVYGRGMDGHTGVYKGGDSGNIMRGYRGDLGPLQHFGRGRFMGSAETVRLAIMQGQALPATVTPTGTPNSVKDLLARTSAHYVVTQAPTPQGAP